MAIKYDKRVKEIIETALTKYERTFENWELTPEFLLFSMLEDPKSLLNVYMYLNGLFQCYFTDVEQAKISNGEDLEDDCYMVLLDRLNTIIYAIEKEIPVDPFEEVTPFSEELKEILNYAENLSLKLKRKELKEDCLTVAVVQYYNILWSVLNKWDKDEIATSYLSNYFSEENLAEIGLIEEMCYVNMLN